jgi:hypothetical protein
LNCILLVVLLLRPCDWQKRFKFQRSSSVSIERNFVAFWSKGACRPMPIAYRTIMDESLFDWSAFGDISIAENLVSRIVNHGDLRAKKNRPTTPHNFLFNPLVALFFSLFLPNKIWH